jgi:hypothetical protein
MYQFKTEIRNLNRYSQLGTVHPVHAEIEYTKLNGESIHSDICPPNCLSSGLNNLHYRKFLHDCLDEWLNKSNGTGAFYIKNESFKIEY